MEKLLNCPFCGGDAEIGRVGATTDMWCVKCNKCWAKSIYHNEYSKDECIKAWNTRDSIKSLDEGRKMEMFLDTLIFWDAGKKELVCPSTEKLAKAICQRFGTALKVDGGKSHSDVLSENYISEENARNQPKPIDSGMVEEFRKEFNKVAMIYSGAIRDYPKLVPAIRKELLAFLRKYTVAPIEFPEELIWDGRDCPESIHHKKSFNECLALCKAADEARRE